jgi:PAS domain S-box-containing protein
MIAWRARTPFGAAAVVAGIAFVALGAVTVPWALRVDSRETRRTDELATSLADAAVARSEERLAACRRTTRLLAEQLAPAIAAAGDPGAARSTLAALRRTFPETLRAAVIADGAGSVLAASESWREGSRPDWLTPAGSESGIYWQGGAASHRFVAREGILAPPGVAAPLWLATLWDAEEVIAALQDLSQTHPHATWLLEAGDQEVVLRWPAGRPDPDTPAVAVRDLGRTGLRYRVLLPRRSSWTFLGLLVAIAGALASGVVAATMAATRGRMVSAITRRLGSTAEGVDAPPSARGERTAPEIEAALARLRQEAEGSRRREATIRAALERVRGGALLVTDPAGTVEFVAGETSKVLGLASHDVTGRPLRRLLGGPAWDALLPALSRAGLEGEGATLEVEQARPAGGTVSLELTVTARDRAGGFVLMARDVTDAARLRHNLEVSAARARALVERLQDGVAVVRDGRIEAANAAFAAILGLSIPEVEGAPLKRFVAAPDVMMALDHLRRATPDGATTSLRLLRSDALDPRETLATLTALPGGECLLVVRDLTESRRAERRLEQARGRLDATLTGITQGVLAVEPRDGLRVSFANPALEALTRVRPDSLLGLPEEEALQRLVAAGALPARFLEWATTAARAASLPVRASFPAADGATVLEVAVSDLVIPRSAARGRIYAFHDVTAQAAAERHLHDERDRVQARGAVLEESNRELERVNRDLAARTAELDQVNARLRKLDEMRAQLLANVTHELQTPLVSIRGYTEMILRGKIGPITSEQSRGLEISLRNIDRLIGLIDNLVDLSRGDEALPQLHLTTFELKGLIDEVLDLMRERAARRAVRLGTMMSAGDVLLHADRDRIAQVLINLVENGIKFSEEGGTVAIEVGEARRGFAHLQVRDSGPGIPAEELERVFERHYRASEVQQAGIQGSGLGLAICRQILRLHGCTIRASNADGGGALLSFTLPLAREGERPDIDGEVRRRASSASPR